MEALIPPYHLATPRTQVCNKAEIVPMQDQNHDVFGIDNGSLEARIGHSISKLQ
jgi:hypothetical protein